jgi:EAL domain-containing protein (putative c-di-GMP-specific phosphodiesterase class I)
MMPNEQHLAEHSGIIGEIGRWVLERACADGHRWQNTGQRDNLTMSVNVSPHQLMSPPISLDMGITSTETVVKRGARIARSSVGQLGEQLAP